ncbi:hypothetical protein DCC84_07815 [Pseudomonas sp. SXM-1]|nr:hypothetical protein DCC84_07815 [Pseudomonas sp. SXM-1]
MPRRLAGLFFAPCPVGASLLAKNPRSPRSVRMVALSLTIIASKLAPTQSRDRRGMGCRYNV